MKGSISKINRKVRITLHIMALIISIILGIIYSLTRSAWFFVSALSTGLLAGLILLFSPDKKEWFEAGRIFTCLILWSRRHPVLLALIISAQPALVFTVVFLFILRDFRKLYIALGICLVGFLVSAAYGSYLAKKVEEKDVNSSRGGNV